MVDQTIAPTAAIDYYEAIIPPDSVIDITLGGTGAAGLPVHVAPALSRALKPQKVIDRDAVGIDAGDSGINRVWLLPVRP